MQVTDSTADCLSLSSLCADVCCCVSSRWREFSGYYGRIEHGFVTRPDLVAVDNPVNPRQYCGHF